MTVAGFADSKITSYIVIPPRPPQAVRRSASSINNPAMDDRFVRRLHKEFDEAVKAGKQEGFTVCLVNGGDIMHWVVKFHGPVS